MVVFWGSCPIVILCRLRASRLCEISSWLEGWVSDLWLLSELSWLWALGPVLPSLAWALHLCYPKGARLLPTVAWFGPSALQVPGFFPTRHFAMIHENILCSFWVWLYHIRIVLYIVFHCIYSTGYVQKYKIKRNWARGVAQWWSTGLTCIPKALLAWNPLHCQAPHAPLHHVGSCSLNTACTSILLCRVSPLYSQIQPVLDQKYFVNKSCLYWTGTHIFPVIIP
jgi:hypothetical protein